MTQINANILRENDEATLTVTVEGDPRSPYMARDDHPNFKLMIAAIVAGEEEELPKLFNVAETVAVEFQRLSERVTVEHGQVRFDGVAVDTTLTRHIMDAVLEGADEESYKALVAFMEKVQTNPDARSREQLYNWINAQDGLTITESGDMVGYKYVNTDSEFGYRSSASGVEPVRVTWGDRSEVFTGRIPNPIDAIVEMPRDLVDSDPNRTCSVGLHIGAWNYVKGNSTILEVHVNPRDVVAVPTDYRGEKVRACRYRVRGPITQKYGQAVKKDGEGPKADVRNGAQSPTDRADLDLTLAPLRDKKVAETQPEGLKVGDRVELLENYTLNFPEGTQAVVVHGPDGCDLIGIVSDEGKYTQVFTRRVMRIETDEGGLTIGPFTEGDLVVDQDGNYRTVVRHHEDDSVLALTHPERDPKESTTSPLLPSGRTRGGIWSVTKVGIDFGPEFAVGDRVIDQDGDEGTVKADLTVEYDAVEFSGRPSVSDPTFQYTVTDSSGRPHGKGGGTSQAAKGRGLNPAQDPKTGQFVNGRPGSRRDPRTGRFGG